MQLYLIRHTKVSINSGICYGQSDIALANTFEDEAQKIKSQISEIYFDKIYSSPLIRCKRLSEILFNSNVIYDDRLMELNFGEWEMQEWNKITHPIINRWMTDFVNTPCPNGESFVDLHNRVKTFLSELKNKTCQNVVIITHGGVIRSIFSYIQNEDLRNAFKREIKYGEVLKLTI